MNESLYKAYKFSWDDIFDKVNKCKLKKAVCEKLSGKVGKQLK